MGQNIEADIVIIFFMTNPRVGDKCDFWSFSLGVNSHSNTIQPSVASGIISVRKTIESLQLNSFWLGMMIS